ncbi:Low-density lipoprotein (LDL) receptor class A repeat [Trinorchestia longiramus]|nr:Low-density lipoprotein (LDL) receptor class A repeat [Trinorchestia longiramus]
MAKQGSLSVVPVVGGEEYSYRRPQGSPPRRPLQFQIESHELPQLETCGGQEGEQEAVLQWNRNPLVCWLCDALYEDPRLLSCYHVFCGRCLTPRILDNRIYCPLCCKATTTKDGQLPPRDNLMVFLLESSCEERTPCANCNDGNHADFFCNTCGQALCCRCREATHRARMFAAHEVVPMSKRGREGSKKCPTHGEPYIMFSAPKHGMLCINCFRESNVEARLLCTDIETAYSAAVRKLDRGVLVSVTVHKLDCGVLVSVTVHKLDRSVLVSVTVHKLDRGVLVSVAVHKLDRGVLVSVTVHKLDYGALGIRELQSSVRDGVVLFKALLDELRSNADMEKSNINNMADTLQDNLRRTQEALLREVDSQYESKDKLFRSQLSSLGSLLPIIQVHLLMCTSFATTASKHEFLDVVFLLMERLAAIAHLSHPLRPGQSSQIRSNFRQEFARSLEMMSSTGKAREPSSSTVACPEKPPSECLNQPPRSLSAAVDPLTFRHSIKSKLPELEGPFADHCKGHESRFRDLSSKFGRLKEEAQELHRDVTHRRCVARRSRVEDIVRESAALEEEVRRYAEELEETKAAFDSTWDELIQRIYTEQELLQTHMNDVANLRDENKRLMIIAQQLEPYIRSITSLMERISPRLQVRGNRCYETPLRSRTGFLPDSKSLVIDVMNSITLKERISLRLQVPASQMLSSSQICLLESRDPSSAVVQQIIDQMAACNRSDRAEGRGCGDGASRGALLEDGLSSKASSAPETPLPQLLPDGVPLPPQPPHLRRNAPDHSKEASHDQHGERENTQQDRPTQLSKPIKRFPVLRHHPLHHSVNLITGQSTPRGNLTQVSQPLVVTSSQVSQPLVVTSHRDGPASSNSSLVSMEGSSCNDVFEKSSRVAESNEGERSDKSWSRGRRGSEGSGGSTKVMAANILGKICRQHSEGSASIRHTSRSLSDERKSSGKRRELCKREKADQLLERAVASFDASALPERPKSACENSIPPEREDLSEGARSRLRERQSTNGFNSSEDGPRRTHIRPNSGDRETVKNHNLPIIQSGHTFRVKSTNQKFRVLNDNVYAIATVARRPPAKRENIYENVVCFKPKNVGWTMPSKGGFRKQNSLSVLPLVLPDEHRGLANDVMGERRETMRKADSFEGHEEAVNVWNRSLTQDEVTGLASCQTDMQGNYISWDAGWDLKNATSFDVPLHQFCETESASVYFWFSDLPPVINNYICESLGTHLPLPKTVQESTAWLDLAAKILGNTTRCNKEILVAANDFERDGRWVVTYNNEVIDQEKFAWKDGEPNGLTYENCAQIEPGGVADIDCMTRIQCAVCEFKTRQVFSFRGTCETELRNINFLAYQNSVGDLLFRGYGNHQIEKTQNGTWIWKNVVNGRTLATMVHDGPNDFPMGRRLWNLQKPVCNQDEGQRMLLLTSCKDEDYSCSDGTCIPRDLRCDLKYDCIDRSDEAECEIVVLPSDYRDDLPPRGSPIQNLKNLNSPLCGAVLEATPEPTINPNDANRMDFFGESCVEINKDDTRLPVTLSINIETMRVDSTDMYVHASYTLSLSWRDSRLTYVNIKKNSSLNQLRYNTMVELWHPSVGYVNTDGNQRSVVDEEAVLLIKRESEHVHGDNAAPGEVSLYDGSENTLEVSRKYSTVFQCEFYLLLYPFDDQYCDLHFRMLSASQDYIYFDTRSASAVYEGNPILLEYQVLPPLVVGVSSKESSEMKVRLPLSRQYGHAILNIYTPSLILMTISIFNVPASCLLSPKPAPRPAKVEDQQLRYFLQKDKITSFDAFKPERNL